MVRNVNKEMRALGQFDPISVRIPDAVRMTGLSRSKIYLLIAAGDLEAAKVGRSTVVSVESLKAVIQARRILPNEGKRVAKKGPRISMRR